MKSILLAAFPAVILSTFLVRPTGSINHPATGQVSNHTATSQVSNHPVTGQAPNTLTAAEKKDGWHSYGYPSAGADWIIQDGAITLDKSKGGNGDLVTNGIYSDFDLKMDWKISPTGNSGILFYIQEDTTKYKETYFTGPEMQVLDNDGNHDGKIHTHRAGDLYDLIASSTEPVHAVGEWNQAEIYSKGGQLKLFLNGVNIVTTTLWDDHWRDMIAHSKFKHWADFGVSKSGKISLQDHGAPVWYRNIKIKTF
jgi:hypothetical protein